jgi:uncharacterized protein (DUF4213/DUF364 family)
MATCVGWGEDALADEIGELLLPDIDDVPMWATQIFSAPLIQDLQLREGLRLVVLDGPSAIRWLPAIDSGAVVAIIDRRATDDSAAETVLQVRTRSENLLSLAELGWQPPPGVEALAFTVPL